MSESPQGSSQVATESPCTPRKPGSINIAKTPKSRRKTFNFSFLARSGSMKQWRLNNHQLAQENASLRKDRQKLMRIITESTIRHSNLELAWRRRGEVLSKVDLICRLAGNQMEKLADTLAELRSACQIELSTAPEVGTRNSERVSRFRYSMPETTKRLNRPPNVSHLPNKSQLINHVNPMVSGHTITKPTISLQRLNLQDVPPSSPVEQSQSADEIEEVDLTTIAENSEESSSSSSSSSSDNSDTEVVEVPPSTNTRRMESICSSSPTYGMVLPVAEVPLERLSLTRFSDSCNKPRRTMISGLIMHGEKTFNNNESDLMPCTPDSLLEQNTETRSSEVSSTTTPERTRRFKVMCSFPDDHTFESGSTTFVKNIYKSTNERPEENVSSPTEGSSTITSGRPMSNNSLRKYPASSRARTPTSAELRKSQMNGVNEKCRLVVALKDVSSYLHNGTLASIEQLEEGKVKTGAIAHPELKDHNASGNGSLELNVSDSSVEDRTQLNFTTGIGILDYSPLNTNSVEGSSVLSSEEEFLNRIQNEDPLEGPSWRFQFDDIPATRKRAKPKILFCDQSTEKVKSGSQWHGQSTCSPSMMNRKQIVHSSPKKQSSDKVKNQPIVNNGRNLLTEKEVSVGVETTNEENVELPAEYSKGIRNRNPPHLKKTGKEINNASVPSSNIPENSKLETSLVEKDVGPSNRKKQRRKCYATSEAGVDEDWKPHKNAAKKHGRSKSRSRSAHESKIITSHSREGTRHQDDEEPASKRKASISESKTTQMKPVVTLVCVEDEIGVVEGSGGDDIQRHSRSRRKAAPTNLREPGLNKKIRR